MLGPLLPLLFSFILLPLLLVLLHVQAVSLAFSNMGLSPTLVIIVFYLSLLGSFVNIPISRRRIRVERKSLLPFPFSLPLFYYPPRVQEQVVEVNVGGAVVPLLLSLYVLPNAPIGSVLLATSVVAAVCFALARPVLGRRHHHPRANTANHRSGTGVSARPRSCRAHRCGLHGRGTGHPDRC